MIRSTLSTFTKHTMGRVRRRTSTKQRSITLVVRSFRHRCRGKVKKDSSSGKSRSRRRTTLPYSRAPTHPQAAEGGFGLGTARSQVDGLGARLHFVVVRLPYFLQNIPHLVHPAALMSHPRIDRRNRRR